MAEEEYNVEKGIKKTRIAIVIIVIFVMVVLAWLAAQKR